MTTIKLWLDDERPAPAGYVACRWPAEVIARLEGGDVCEVSLDHDLGETGPYARTGYDVLTWLEKRVAQDPTFALPRVKLHTANPVARRRMESALAQIRHMKEPKP